MGPRVFISGVGRNCLRQFYQSSGEGVGESTTGSDGDGSLLPGRKSQGASLRRRQNCSREQEVKQLLLPRAVFLLRSEGDEILRLTSRMY